MLVLIQKCSATNAHLQADGQVHSTPKRGTDSPRMEAQILEELGEGLSESNPGPLFCNHDTRPHSRQVQPSCLQKTTVVTNESSSIRL